MQCKITTLEKKIALEIISIDSNEEKNIFESNYNGTITVHVCDSDGKLLKPEKK